jgi:acyl-CoA thioesterase-1
MNGIIYFFGSEAAFFVGVGLVLAAVALLGFYCRRWSTVASTLLALIGLILITLSAVPLPYWFYAAGGLISLSWLVAERIEKPSFAGTRRSLRLFTVVLWLVAVIVEIPYQIAPNLEPIGRPTLYIFADSVAAGMGETSVETWPKLLARSHSINIQDHSEMGAKGRTMLRKVEKLSLGDGIVLLEIGGNDLLGSTSVNDFERDLDQLLTRLCWPGRVVIMFELPLPPFSNQFGRVQRRLAGKHHAQLIPKRIFVSVLTADGATVDSVHLTQKGHELMAETVWSLIRKAYSD